MLVLGDAVTVLLGVVECVDFVVRNLELVIGKRAEVFTGICDCRCRCVIVENSFCIEFVGGKRAHELAHEFLLEEHLLCVALKSVPGLLELRGLLWVDAALCRVVSCVVEHLRGGYPHAAHHLAYIGVGCFPEHGF